MARGEIRFGVKRSTRLSDPPAYTARARGYGVQCGALTPEAAVAGLLRALASRDVLSPKDFSAAKVPCT